MPIHNHRSLTSDNEPDPISLLVTGAYLPIEVHVPPDIAALLTAQGQPVPTPISGAALIDTGASITCVREPALQKLGLNPIDIVETGTVNGSAHLPLYPARLVFPGQNWIIDLAVVLGADLEGQQIQTEPPQDLLVLIGRNVLQKWLLIWDGPHATWTIATDD